MFEAKNIRSSKYLQNRRTYKPKRFKVSTRKFLPLAKTMALTFIICSFLYIGYNYFFISEKYKISDIQITGSLQYVSPSDLHTMVEGKVLGTNMFKVQPDNVSKVIMDNFMSVKDVRVEREFPDVVKVYVEERKPIAYICSVTKECFYIDKEAYVLGRVGDSYVDLPKINYVGDIFLGEKLSEDIIPVSFEIITEAATNRVNVSSISYSPKYFEIFIENSISAILGRKRSVSDNMEAIKDVLKRSRLEGKSVKKIDLRYDNVVVSYY